MSKSHVYRLANALCALAFLTGCAFSSHTVVPSVALQAPRSTVGAGHSVNVTVIDDRGETDIGNRGAMLQAAPIHLGGDIVAETSRSVTAALTQMGFRVAPDASTTLRIEIRGLDYRDEMGFWTGTRHATAAVKAIAANGATTYEKIYRSDTKGHGLAIASGGAISEKVNGALADSLDQLITDPQLLSVLAGGDTSK